MLDYKTSDYLKWYLELGFKAVKVFLRHGPDAGLAGLNKNVELVAQAREQVGPDIELAVDSWLSLNVEYAVRVVEALKPYQIKWLEDYLLPEDMESYANLRSRVPGQTLATGEHWYTIHPFAEAAGGAGRHHAAGHPMGGRRHCQRADLPYCGGPWAYGDRARRHELSLRSAPGLRDAGDRLGRALRGRIAAGCTLGGDDPAARHTAGPRRLRPAVGRAGLWA